jgi:ATP-dependent protease ClpP protease subunit
MLPSKRSSKIRLESIVVVESQNPPMPFTSSKRPRRRLDDEEDDPEEFDPDLVFSYNNHVYFYSPVTTKSVLCLYKELTKAHVHALQNNLPIELHLQSEGGELFPGLSAMDHITHLQKSGVEVHGILEGCVASAATVIAMGCCYLYAFSNSYVLIHQLSTGFHFGRFRDFSQEFENSKKMDASLRELYKKKTNLSATMLDKLFGEEVYLSSAECVVHGIVDEIRG